MACYHPLLAYKCDGKVVFDKPFAFAKGFNLPCGQCWGCRLQHSREWAIRCMHEAQMHEHNSFITLTINLGEFDETTGILSGQDKPNKIIEFETLGE